MFSLVGSLVSSLWYHTTTKSTTVPFRGLLLSVLVSYPATLQIWQITSKRKTPECKAYFIVFPFSSGSWHLNSDCIGRPKLQFLFHKPWRLPKALLASLPLVRIYCLAPQPLTQHQEFVNALRRKFIEHISLTLYGSSLSGILSHQILATLAILSYLHLFFKIFLFLLLF